tara:strand:+ start:1091 stop:1621 length:531 start_codon:yes stop_codon:yes gene_type:complete
MYKNIKWGNKELPGITHEELAELTASKLAKQDAGKIAGEINVKSGEVFNALNKAWERRDELIESGEFSEMAAKGYAGIKDKESHKKHMQSIQVEGRNASKKARKLKAKTKNEKVLSELLNTMESNKWYTADEISELHSNFTHPTYANKKVRRFVLKNQDSFKVDYNSHQTKLFKKI